MRAVSLLVLLLACMVAGVNAQLNLDHITLTMSAPAATNYVVGDTVTLTATLFSGLSTQTPSTDSGIQVTFTQDGVSLTCTSGTGTDGKTDSSGVAVCATTLTTAAGTGADFQASFPGDSTYNSKTS